MTSLLGSHGDPAGPEGRGSIQICPPMPKRKILLLVHKWKDHSKEQMAQSRQGLGWIIASKSPHHPLRRIE